MYLLQQGRFVSMSMTSWDLGVVATCAIFLVGVWAIDSTPAIWDEGGEEWTIELFSTSNPRVSQRTPFDPKQLHLLIPAERKMGSIRFSYNAVLAFSFLE
jgi:hypothetical protein